ncbi:MAG: tetratricopeptide repeat protein, partial [Acidobacteriota bacterium]
GEILERDREATVIVMSDHGFSSTDGRPREIKPFIEGQPGLWHDMRGIFLIGGPGVSSGEIPLVTLYDIAPTILYLLGLPVASDMPGKVLDAALSPDLLERYPAARVPTYEVLVTASGEQGGQPEAASDGQFLTGGAEAEILEQLRSLGYIGGDPGNEGGQADRQAGEGEGVVTRAPAAGAEAAPSTASGPPPGGGLPTLLYYVNLGGVYLSQRKLDEAEAEFRRALAIAPDFPPALAGLALLQEAKGEPERALATLRRLYDADVGDHLATLLKMATLFIGMERPSDGLAYLEGLAPYPENDRYVIGVAMSRGLLMNAAGRPDEAEAAFLDALRTDPTSVIAMQELFALYDAQGRASNLEPMLRSALERAPESGMHHNWLGLVMRRRGDLAGAEDAFRRTLEVAPDLIGAMANLGSLYMQQRRSAEAVEILGQALEKDRNNIEARTNLIVAHGMEGRLEEARALLDEAEERGHRVPQYHNAMAYALHINGRAEEALQAINRALALDPRQPDALRLRQQIEAARTDALPYW